MTSLRQIIGNRRNAEKSTGPKSENGKRRSRRNALRHGLCAETVIEILEDVEDYNAFELAVTTDYDAQTAVERELILRLASLLWRVRRATAIETDLFRIQAEWMRAGKRASAAPEEPETEWQNVANQIAEPGCPPRSGAEAERCRKRHEDAVPRGDCCGRDVPSYQKSVRHLAQHFLGLGNLTPDAFERIGRYEAALWRQIVQTLFALQSARRRLGPALANEWWRRR
jgi:hypothetical protein